MVIPASASAAPGGNAANAKACQQGGWQQWVRADGSTFKNTGECTSHAAKGGTLQLPAPPAPADPNAAVCAQYGGTFATGPGPWWTSYSTTYGYPFPAYWHCSFSPALTTTQASAELDLYHSCQATEPYGATLNDDTYTGSLSEADCVQTL
jgi:hypothetical protein